VPSLVIDQEEESILVDRIRDGKLKAEQELLLIPEVKVKRASIDETTQGTKTYIRRRY
jgi:hypothetical protein